MQFSVAPKTTQEVRKQAFLPLTGDIPEGVTLRQYRSQRPPPGRRGWRGRARLRLTLR
jgi:hypothetical protein